MDGTFAQIEIKIGLQRSVAIATAFTDFWNRFPVQDPILKPDKSVLAVYSLIGRGKKQATIFTLES
jgi:hypothetical protein